MKKRIAYLSVLLFFIASGAAFSAERMRIVVLNLKADGVADRTARTVSNMLRTEFINLGKFTVVERAQMDAILKEQGLQQTGCTDQECAVQIGKLMSAKKILVGEVSPMGKSIITTVRIVDVEKGISEFAATQKADSEEVLDVAVGRIAKQIAARIEGETPVYTEVRKEKVEEKAEEKAPEVPGVKTRTGYYLRGIVPGWGQFYAERKIKGYVYLGAFAVSSIFAILTINDYKNKKQEYDDLGSTASESEFNDKYDAYNKAAGAAKFWAVVFGLVYVVNWADILFLSTPNFDPATGMLNNNYNKNFFTFNAYMPSRHTNEKQIDFGIGMRF